MNALIASLILKSTHAIVQVCRLANKFYMHSKSRALNSCGKKQLSRLTFSSGPYLHTHIWYLLYKIDFEFAESSLTAHRLLWVGNDAMEALSTFSHSLHLVCLNLASNKSKYKNRNI